MKNQREFVMSSNKKRPNKRGHSMAELDKMFARIKSRFNNLLFFDQMSPAELKKLNEMWRRAKPMRWDDFTEEQQKALAKEQAQLQRENKREQEWDSIRKFLQIGIDIKSDDPNSELYKTAKELQDIVDKAQAESLSVSKYEQQKFCTGFDRYKVLLKAELNRQLKEKPAETGQKDEGSKIMITARIGEENWEAIRGEYDISKKDFGKKINFVSDPFKREIIFRDVEHAFVLASQGFSKPALILAGGVIEELLRLYLEHKNIKPKKKQFFAYIEACEDKGLLKRGVSRLTDSIRDFRNLVHLDNEETKRHTVSKATAKGAVASIFTIANDFQKVLSN